MIDDPSRSGIHLRTTFCQEILHNFHVIRNALKGVRELQTTLLFYFLVGLTYPQIWNFLYYFTIEVAGISQFTYQMVAVSGAVWTVAGVLIY